MLINNGFSEKNIVHQTKIINKWYNSSSSEDPRKPDITIYYHALFSTVYKEDERIITQIVKRNVKPTDPEMKIKLQIYYRNKKTSHLLLRKSPHKERQPRSHTPCISLPVNEETVKSSFQLTSA